MLTCKRNTTQNSIGWIAMLDNGEVLYAEESYDHFRSLGLTIMMLNKTESKLQLIAVNTNLTALQCQFIQSFNAMPVLSNKINISVISMYESVADLIF